MTPAGRSNTPPALSAASITTAGLIQVITLTGEIDTDTAAVLTQALAATSEDCVVLDLSHVTFMDSAGINTLLRAHRTLTAAGRHLRLAAPAPLVLRVLRLTGLDVFLDCRPTLGEALTA
jgi:stage II sporulation protein AA (anti-sigma F factor antagonist)